MTSAIPAELQDALAGSLSIEREIGRGGMGVVYLARDVMLDRPLALKVLHPHLAADPEQRARFLREARTGARLSHPHIVPIYDVGEAAGHVWFTMAFVDGESLATVLTRRGTLPAATVERLLREVGWALANAHRRDVLHRDVSLDNILIERSTGRALLADFGIAARIEGGSAGPLIGTPAYMAPELVHGEPASPRSDLYALGIVAWSALTGYLPFSGDDAAEVLLAQVRDEVPSLARAAAGTPSRLRRAIEAVLAKAPDERPDSVEAWLATLDEPRQRRALAPVLSRWVRVREAVAPYRALAATLLAMFSGVALHLASFGGVTSYFLLLVAFGALLVPGLAILQAGLSLRALRLAAREGFHLEDLRLGLEQELAERRRAGPILPTRWGRVIRWTGSILGIGAVVVLATAESWYELLAVLPFTLRLVVQDILVWVARWGLVAFWLSRGVGILLPGVARPALDVGWRLRLAFWRTRAAAGLMWLARLGLPRDLLPETTLHRPTELMLDLQIDDLWRALPAPTREGLAELPVVARALRERIRDLRALLDRLEDPTTARSSADLELRERLEQRRTEATTALEQLRLVLLRLSGSAAPVGELTHHLQEARALEADLLVDLGAHRAVRRLVRRPTLTPSPAA